MDRKGFLKSDAHNEFARIDEVIRNHEITYAYFIITLNTAATGFAFAQTISMTVNYEMIILLGAVGFWITSIINGLFLVRWLIGRFTFERNVLGNQITGKEDSDENIAILYGRINKKIIRKNWYMYIFMGSGFALYVTWHIFKVLHNC